MSEPYSAAGAGLEVQVRAGDVAGRAGEADLLARGDALADRDADGRQVAVLRVRAVVHLDDDVVAVRAAPAGLDDGAGADRADGGAGRRRGSRCRCGCRRTRRRRRPCSRWRRTSRRSGETKELRRLRSASRAARSLASRAASAFGAACLGLAAWPRPRPSPWRRPPRRPAAGRRPGRRSGRRASRRRRRPGSGRCRSTAAAAWLGGERRGGEGADDAGGGEAATPACSRSCASARLGATVLPGGTGERHEVAGPFLPSRLPG